MAINSEILIFITYCISQLGHRLHLSQQEVYRRLKSSGILYDYIVPSYDVLHTFGSRYLMDDLTEYMREKGVLPAWYCIIRPMKWWNALIPPIQGSIWIKVFISHPTMSRQGDMPNDSCDVAETHGWIRMSSLTILKAGKSFGLTVMIKHGLISYPYAVLAMMIQTTIWWLVA